MKALGILPEIQETLDKDSGQKKNIDETKKTAIMAFDNFKMI